MKTPGSNSRSDMEQQAEQLLCMAENGDTEAQALVGNFCIIGKGGFPVNYERALHYSVRAAEKGHPVAQTNMGQIYLRGLGVEKDREKAMGYLEKAMDQGFMKSFRYAGIYYAESGQFSTAAAFYEMGAQRGDITSQFLLGQCYEDGVGVEQNIEKAIHWYRISARRGDEIARPAMDALARLKDQEAIL